MKNAKIEKFQCDILDDFQTMCKDEGEKLMMTANNSNGKKF